MWQLLLMARPSPSQWAGCLHGLAPAPEIGEMPPWRLGGNAAVNPVDRRQGQSGEATLERVWRWVNLFEAKKGKGLTT
jgi:hypothetical protein